jgi:hypothetical protein
MSTIYVSFYDIGLQVQFFISRIYWSYGKLHYNLNPSMIQKLFTSDKSDTVQYAKENEVLCIIWRLSTCGFHLYDILNNFRNMKIKIRLVFSKLIFWM